MFALSPSEAQEHWAQVRALFERAERLRGEPLAEALHERAAQSLVQIWGLQDAERIHAVVATELISTARGKICNILTASGGAPLALQARLLDEIGKWARGLGCVAVRVSGRRGWLRRFPRLRPVGVIAEWSLKRLN